MNLELLWKLWKTNRATLRCTFSSYVHVQSSWQACSIGSDAKMGFECRLLQAGCLNPRVSHKATNVSVFCLFVSVNYVA